MRRVSAEQPKLDSKASRLGPANDSGEPHLAAGDASEHQAQRSPEHERPLTLHEHPTQADVLGHRVKFGPVVQATRDLDADRNPVIFALFGHDQFYGPAAPLVNGPVGGVQQVARQGVSK